MFILSPSEVKLKTRTLTCATVIVLAVAGLSGCSSAGVRFDAPDPTKASKTITSKGGETAGKAADQLRSKKVSDKQKWVLGCNALNAAYLSNNVKNSASLRVVEEVAKAAPTKEQRKWAQTAVAAVKLNKKASKLPKDVRNEIVSPCKKRGVKMGAFN